jgi:hypothetical protein
MRRTPRDTLSLSLLPALAVLLAGCGGSSNDGPQPTGCSIAEQNQFVYDVMRDIYLWNDRIPVVDAATFDSPEALLAAIAVPEDNFSFIASAAADDAFFGEGQFAGLGFRSEQTAPDEQRVLDVFEGSPAGLGGLARGDAIIAVNGRPIGEVLAEEGFSASLGPPELGVTVALDWENVAGERFSEVFEKAVVTIPPVSAASVIDTPLGPVGYLLFRNFVDPAVGELDRAFLALDEAGVRELVVDLRYNSGGLLTVAQVLANLIGGEITQAQVQYFVEYNADNSFRNEAVAFRDRNGALDLQRVVFITTGSTASASELVTNSLSPYIDVVLIGDTTFGKPVGQLGYVFCENILRPVSFRLANADGVTDYFDGFPPDCLAADDIERALGDPAEASLAEALLYLETGACTGGPAGAALERQRAAKPEARTRWRPLDAH